MVIFGGHAPVLLARAFKLAAATSTPQSELTALSFSGPDWVILIDLPAAAPAGKFEDVVDVRATLLGEPPAEIAVSGYVSAKK